MTPRLTAAFERLVRVCRRWTTTDTADVAADVPAEIAVVWRTATALLKGASEAHKMPLSCGRGCSACCRGEVLVTPEEARVIASRLTMAQAQAVRTAPRLTNLRKCPLLTTDGDCGVYSLRPLTCRLYHAVTPPEDCEPIDGVKVGLEGQDFSVIRLAGYASGVGELVRMVQAELERPGKSRVFAVPVFDYQKHNQL